MTRCYRSTNQQSFDLIRKLREESVDITAKCAHDPIRSVAPQITNRIGLILSSAATRPGQWTSSVQCIWHDERIDVACIRICMVDACVIYLMSGLAHNNFCNSVAYGLAQLLLLAYTLHEHKQQRRSKSKKTNQRFICFVCLSFCFVSSINLSMHWTSTGDYWFLIQTFFFSDCTFLNHSKPASTIGTKLTYTILHAQIITMKTNLEKQRNAKIIQK